MRGPRCVRAGLNGVCATAELKSKLHAFVKSCPRGDHALQPFCNEGSLDFGALARHVADEGTHKMEDYSVAAAMAFYRHDNAQDHAQRHMLCLPPYVHLQDVIEAGGLTPLEKMAAALPSCFYLHLKLLELPIPMPQLHDQDGTWSKVKEWLLRRNGAHFPTDKLYIDR